MITLIDEVVDISRANTVVPLLEPGHDYGQLTIRGCTFKDGSLKVILDKLKRNNSVIKFGLTGVPLSIEECLLISDLMKYNNRIEIVDLSYDELDDRKLTTILENISIKPKIAELNISGNKIKGSLGLWKILSCSQVRTLIAYNNDVTDKDAIWKILENNKTTVELNLSGNDITLSVDESVALKTWIEENTCLQALNVKNNPMSLEAIGNLTFGPALPRGWTKRNGTYVREDILQISETFPKIEPGLLQYRKDNKIYYYYNFVTRTVQWQGLKQ